MDQRTAVDAKISKDIIAAELIKTVRGLKLPAEALELLRAYDAAAERFRDAAVKVVEL